MILHPNKKQITHQFSKAAKEYSMFAHNQQWISKQLMQLLPTTIHPKSIIDIGCGTGQLSIKLQKKYNSNVTVIDTAQAMLNELPKHPKITPIHADFNTYSFSQTYDLVISNCSLHWLHDFDGFMQKLKTSQKANTTICFSVYTNKTFHELQQVLSNVKPSIKTAASQFHSITEYKDIIRHYFSTSQFKQFQLTNYYDNLHQLLLTLKRTGTNISMQHNNTIFTKSSLTEIEADYLKTYHYIKASSEILCCLIQV